jgi:tetratricopeptide (TPR) repeat protein
MPLTNSIPARTSLVASIVLLIISMTFSVNQWRAENSWPVQKNFTRQEMENLEIKKAVAVKQAIAVAPGNATYHVLLGKYNVYEAPVEADQRKALLNEAVSEYRQALFLNPSFTDALSYLAWAEFSVEKPLDALLRLETATTFDPNNYFNQLYYGICVSRFLGVIPDYLRGIYVRRAEGALERGISLYPMMARQPMVISAQADLYLRRGDLDAAISVLEQAKPPNSSTLPYHLRLASLYLRANITEKSIKKYSFLLRTKALEKNHKGEIINSLRADSMAYPEVLEIRYLLGRALVEDGQWLSAIETLKALAEKDFRPAQTHFLLAQAYESLGDRKSAYEEYVTTLNYQRNHPVASTKVIELFKESSR